MRFALFSCFALGLGLAACAKAPAPTASPPFPSAPEIVAVATPDANWHLAIERVLETNDEVWILAQLTRKPGPAAQTIRSAEATVPVALPAKPRRVFVAGKTWSWPNNEAYEFVPSLETVARKANVTRVLYVTDKN